MIRDTLAARRRKLMILAFAAWLGFAFSGVLAAQQGISWLPLPFFALFGVAVLLNIFWLKCPRCAGSLGMTNASLTGRVGLFSRRINFCPYCGVSLDETWDKPK
jgi:hypothetical protein